MLELIKKNRSYRRFDSSRPLSRELVCSFVEGARYVASAANLQRLRFTVVCEKEKCDGLFPSLKFAGYLKEWGGPSESERPTAYVIISSSHELDNILAVDVGIAAEAITLLACEAGVGGCMFKSYTADVVKSFIPSEEQKPHLVIALGYPAEKVYITDVVSGDVKYYRDENDDHFVPKLSLDELIF